MIAIQSGNTSSRIDIEFDVSKDNSIKSTEHEGRGEDTGLTHVSSVAGQMIQQWRRLLIKFLFQAWRNDTYPEKLGSKLLFITCGKQCFKVTKDGSEVVDELTTSQEKANTLMLPHA